MVKNNRKLLLIASIVMTIVIVGGIFIYYTQSATAINRYESIPESPDDFQAYKRDVQAGQLFDVCGLEEKYWKQPEWYGDSWRSGKKRYNNPDYSKWGVWAHGSMPSKIGFQVDNMDKGNTLEACNFLHSGWGVWTWQGFKLKPIENEYFNVTIEPKQLILGPTFPVFEEDWAKRVKLKIEAKKDIPEGNYIIGYRVQEPDSIKSNEWTKKVLNLEYENKQKYIDKCSERINRDKCDKLINNRQKKFVDGSEYKTEKPLLEVHIKAK